jgi:hypothetical protein
MDEIIKHKNNKINSSSLSDIGTPFLTKET